MNKWDSMSLPPFDWTPLWWIIPSTKTQHGRITPMQVRINTPINTSINTYANVINQTLLNSTNLISSEAKPSTKKQVTGIASGNTWNAQRVGASGLGGGVSAELQGGNFKDGFAGGFVGSAAGGMMGKGNNWSDIAGRTAISAAAGGVAAELGGGKFSNGARSAAFVHLFNAEGATRAFRSAFGNDYVNDLDLPRIRTQAQIDSGQKSLTIGMASAISGGVAFSSIKTASTFVFNSARSAYYRYAHHSQRVVDFVTSFFPGAPVATGSGLTGSYIQDKYHPENLFKQ